MLIPWLLRSAGSKPELLRVLMMRCARLDALLEETVANGRLTRFVWLRKFEVGKNSADVNRLLDRMEFLKDLGLSPDILDGVPPHRVARLRRQGERYFADEVRDISSDTAGWPFLPSVA